MKTIWKYKWDIFDRQTLQMPAGAEVLTIQKQKDETCIWAMVDTEQPLEAREFALVGTGHPIPDGVVKYVGTYQMLNGVLVFHVFEILSRGPQ